MFKLALPILVLSGLAGGVGAGMALRPAPEPCNAEADPACAEAGDETEAQAKEDDHGAPTQSEFVELNRQFVVPLLRDGRVSALVVASLAVEVDSGMTETVHALQPKLRDIFLEVLFTHAHSGGFDGDFTALRAREDLKTRLLERARPIFGAALRDVLITEIVRQEM